MGVEIEHKFLVTSEDWRKGAEGVLYVQGYLSNEKDRTVRVRLAGEKGFITIKGAPDETGLARNEYEYPIPAAEAREMLDEMCLPGVIEKVRHKIQHGGLTWEVDEFKGANAGLIVAEIEVPSVNHQFSRPSWVGAEVSQDSRYSNAMLSKKPYSQWKQDSQQCQMPKR
jgi:adenylate cyclase